MSNEESKSVKVRTIVNKYETMVQMTRNEWQWQSIGFDNKEQMIAFRDEMNRAIEADKKS